MLVSGYWRERGVGGERKAGDVDSYKKWVLNYMEQSTGSCLGPHEMMGHFGWCVWFLVFWSVPQTPKHPRTVRAGHTLDICQTNLDLTERQHSAASWFFAQLSHSNLSCLMVGSGVKVTKGHTLASRWTPGSCLFVCRPGQGGDKTCSASQQQLLSPSNQNGWWGVQTLKHGDFHRHWPLWRQPAGYGPLSLGPCGHLYLRVSTVSSFPRKGTSGW